jgi:hypothetical protein
VAREPRQKGTSVLPVIKQLKAHPDREKFVPESLWKYFDDHLLVSGWYPEQDYFVLLQALVKTIDPKTVGGDVWRYFAKFSVQHDIAGVDDTGDATDAKGVYRNFASTAFADPEQLFKRAVRLWSQYHVTSTMQIVGGRARTNSVIVQLAGFSIPIEGFVRLQGYYLEEFGRVLGVAIESKVTKSTARGQPLCEWDYVVARTPTSEAYVASLPPVT